MSSRGAQSTELVSLYIGYWTLNNYYYYYYYYYYCYLHSPKNKRGNKCDSNNYRQISISSLLGKIFDTIILDKQKMSLETDVLLFGFKNNSSTVIRTSMLKETIDYYNENKTDFYFYYWMPRRPLTELNIINYSIDCVTGICVQLYYDY